MSNRPSLGIQLYTVRDLTGDETFEETLTELAGLGFEGVEFAWKYGGMGPDDLAAFLDSVGLRCCGLHVQLDELMDASHEVYDYALACGSPFITTSLFDRSADWRELVPRVEAAAKVAGTKGLQFTYHNHWHEFEPIGGELPEEILCSGTDASAVALELDLGWIAKTGADAMAYWREKAGRVPQIHLRDYDASRETICDVGTGCLNVAAVVAQAIGLGTSWVIFEQDTYPESPMASARVCIDRCREAGLID